MSMQSQPLSRSAFIQALSICSSLEKARGVITAMTPRPIRQVGGYSSHGTIVRPGLVEGICSG